MSRAWVAAGAFVVLVAACSTSMPAAARPTSTPLPPGGISRDKAIAIATGKVGSQAGIKFVSAEVGEYSKYAGPGANAPPTALVWAVTFSGRFVHPCMAPPSPCEVATSETVLLDYVTGAVIQFNLQDPPN